MYFGSDLKVDQTRKSSPLQAFLRNKRCLRFHLITAGIITAGSILVGAILASPDYTPVDTHRSISGPEYTQSQASRTQRPLELPDEEAPNSTNPAVTAPQDNSIWHEAIVKPGDTLSSIFSNLNIYSQLPDVFSVGKEVQSFKSIYPGQRIRIRIHAGSLQELIYEVDDKDRLHITRTDQGLTIKRISRPPEIRQVVATGKIDHSLFRAAHTVGLPSQLIMKLITILGWDIDFALDIRQGDSFTVVYEENFIDGKKVAEGDIVALEFVNQGEVYRAFRYRNAQGRTDYYTSDGYIMRKPFLRTPVDVARISSKFNLKRKHPLLNRIRAHKGVDYAAPKGTPIKATGDGKVIFKNNKGGYGKTIILKHGSKYSTLYAHMSRFARNVRIGSQVKQGQIIGYIGKTGLASGPHLHYEFRINGVHRNPLTVELPSVKSLPDSQVGEFLAKIQPLVDQLNLHGGALVTAKN